MRDPSAESGPRRPMSAVYPSTSSSSSIHDAPSSSRARCSSTRPSAAHQSATGMLLPPRARSARRSLSSQPWLTAEYVASSYGPEQTSSTMQFAELRCVHCPPLLAYACPLQRNPTVAVLRWLDNASRGVECHANRPLQLPYCSPCPPAALRCSHSIGCCKLKVSEWGCRGAAAGAVPGAAWRSQHGACLRAR